MIDTLHKQFENAKIKGWDKVYICVDIHDTIVHRNYVENVLPTDFLFGAEETLKYLSTRKDVCLILYSCSHPHEIVKYLEFFESKGIHFKYCNENPEVPNNALGCYDKKLYFNILLDDKSGWIESDWIIIYDFFMTNSL